MTPQHHTVVHIRTVHLDNQWSGLHGIVRNFNSLFISAINDFDSTVLCVILTINQFWQFGLLIAETDGLDVHNTIPMTGVIR